MTGNQFGKFNINEMIAEAARKKATDANKNPVPPPVVTTPPPTQQTQAPIPQQKPVPKPEKTFDIKAMIAEAAAKNKPEVVVQVINTPEPAAKKKFKIEIKFGKNIIRWIETGSDILAIGLITVYLSFNPKNETNKTPEQIDSNLTPNKILVTAPKKDTIATIKIIRETGEDTVAVTEPEETQKVEPDKTPENGPKPLARFKQEIYESLPSIDAKSTYKYFAEKNPTPGRGYMFLDKGTGRIYIFNEKNELIGEPKAGFGKTNGDQPNNAYESGWNKGNMTTPAGGYLVSDFVSPSNAKTYGKMGVSLVGRSIKGIKSFLGLHQIYPKEFKSRKNKIESGEFQISNGCINIDPEDYKRYVEPYFTGDYAEFLFVSRDKVSTDAFDVEECIKKMAPEMLEVARKQETELLSYISSNTKKIADRSKKLLDLYKKPGNEAEINRVQNEIDSDRGIIEGQKEELKAVRKRIAVIEKILSAKS